MDSAINLTGKLAEFGELSGGKGSLRSVENNTGRWVQVGRVL